MAHTFQNIDFEDPISGGDLIFGTSETYLPDGWSWDLSGYIWQWMELSVTLTAGDVKEGWDRFELGWSSNEDFVFAFADPYDPLELSLAQWNTGAEATAFESFEREWSTNEDFSFVMGAIASASFDTGAENFEDFEEGWGDYDLAMGSIALASFDTSTPEDFEDFEEEWGDYDLAMGSIALASFDGVAPENFEDFEETWLFVYSIYVNSVAAGNYTFTINGVDCTYVASGGETLTALTNSIAAAIDAKKFDSGVETSVLGTQIDLRETSLPADEFQFGASTPSPANISVSRGTLTAQYWTQTGQLE